MMLTPVRPFLLCLSVAAVTGALTGTRAQPPRPPMPPITAPVMFDTPEADRILAALQVFPPENPWNQDISALPVHPDSAKMVAGIGADKPLRHNLDMGFIIVPPDQPRVPVKRPRGRVIDRAGARHHDHLDRARVARR